MSKGKKLLLFSTLTILGLYFLFLGLTEAKAFLIPLVTAIILSLLMVPLSRKMEKGFMSRSWAAFVNTIILLLVSIGFMALVSFQIKSVVEDWPQIKKTMKPKLEQLRSFAIKNTPLEDSDIPEPWGGDQVQGSQSGSRSQSDSGTRGDQNFQSDPGSQTTSSSKSGSSLSSLMGSGSSAGQQAAAFFSQVMSFFADYLLTFIYIFFLLTYRHRFKEFLLRLFPDDRKGDVKEVIDNSAGVTQRYLVGKLLLIGFLAVLYSIGLGISGVNNFILISVLAAVLSLIPYLGNIVGFLLALSFGFLTSGETGVLIGIIITFSIAQFVESYILEPYVVGDQVDLHPFFVILAVIIGNAVWGIAGMVLSIPILAIINVVFLNIGPLHPFGFLLSKGDDE